LQAKQELINKVWGVDILTSAAFDVKKEIINSAEKEIIELAIAIAENILRQKLDTEPELMKKITKSAIDQLSEKEEIRIIVNPALVNNLYDYVDELKEEIRGLKTVKITEDKTIPKDGVIVESPESRIDGRLATRMGEITKNLMREYAEKANSGELSEEINIIIDERAEKLKKID
jgi:flagellar assembly protein FliH